MGLNQRRFSVQRSLTFVALFAMCLIAPTQAKAAEPVCSRFGNGSVAGQVENARLIEISGVVASRRYPGVYWTHNDSGGKPEVFALAIDGTNLGSYAFPGATAVDWEDVGIGPKSGADGSFIYAADIGDNAAELPAGVLGAARPFVTVYRAPEPALAPKAPGVALTGGEHFNLNYPNGREDAEALFVDPISGDLVIVTKSPIGRSRILTAPAASMVDGANITMVDHGTIQIVPTAAASSFRGTFVTGADISLDGSLILVRTYQAVLAFSRQPGESVATALRRESCNARQASEQQGEAIAIATDMSRHVTISEGSYSPINVFSIAAPPSIATTTTTATAPPRPSAGGKILARAGNDATRALLLAGVVVVAVLAVRLRRHPWTKRG